MPKVINYRQVYPRAMYQYTNKCLAEGLIGTKNCAKFVNAAKY